METIRLQLATLQPNTLMVFGLFLLFGVLGGLFANRVRWMPTITAFMVLGFLIGPHGIGLITKTMLQGSSVLVSIALGLILYELGNILHPEEMIRSKRLFFTSMAETIATFVFVFITGMLIWDNAILSAMVGAIAISSSPAVLIHLVEEMRAEGPVTGRAESLVALNNIISFVIFSVALPFALVDVDNTFIEVFLIPLYRLFGSILIGVAVAWLAIRITRILREKDQHYRFAIIIGAVMLTQGLASMMHTSSLFAPLVLGMGTRWFETKKHNLTQIGLGEGGDLFFIVLFVMAGAKIDPAHLMEAGLVAMAFVIARTAGKFLGVFSVEKYTGFSHLQSFSTSLLLLPMAGMAIGIVTTTASLVPELGVRITTIVFAMIAIFETVGPFAAAYAIRITDEAGKMRLKYEIKEVKESKSSASSRN